MPRKNSEKYPFYDRIKQYHEMMALWANFSEMGFAFSDDWASWFDEMNAVMADTVQAGERILNFDQTNTYFRRDQSNLLNRGKRIVAGMESKVREYQGPFKDVVESIYYIQNPNNGDLLELYLDQPVLSRVIMGPIAGAPSFTRMTQGKGKGKSDYEIDPALNNKRVELIGEIYEPITNYLKATKEFAQVLFERQKAEKKRETGLDSVYAAKYASAIDRMVNAFDTFKATAEQRYKRTDLTDYQKDLEFYKDPDTKKEIKVLNNALWEYTSSNPKKTVRNSVATAMENFRAQSKAIKAGWTITEARIMGILAESIEEAKEAIKTHKLELSNSYSKGKELEAELEKERGKAKDIKDTEEASRKAKEIRELEVRIKSNQQSPKEYEIKIHNAEQAMRDAEEIYRKYEKLSNPDYFQRQEALKDLQALFDKYPENDPNKKVISVARRNFTATEEKLTDPYDFAGKTRRQQAEAMLKTLKNVNSWGRSSDNFEALVQSVEKLVELARKYPENMSLKQFQAYERRNADVMKKINIYLKGKEKQQADYKASHDGREKPISEYTARRINAVNKLYSMECAHLRLNSEGHTNEYTGTEEERAMALFERRIREEDRKRERILGKGYKGMFEGGENYDLTSELTSFCRSVYIEKMKERYQYDPAFTAKDFTDSLQLDRIEEGAREEYTNFKALPKFKRHIIDVIGDRVDMDGDGEAETYDSRDYVIRGPIPLGVGHDWVKYELKNYRAMYGLSDPSEDGYDSEASEDPEIDSHENSYDADSELNQSNIIDTRTTKTKKKEKLIEDFESEEENLESSNIIETDIIDTRIKEPKIKEPKIKEPKIKEPKIIETKIKDFGIDEFKIREDPRKENRNTEGIEVPFIVPRDTLAGKIFEMMDGAAPRKSDDPKFISIAKDIAEHAAKEKPGMCTKLSDETLMKMAKYLDSQYDLGQMTTAEAGRWNIVNSAFRQYTQDDASFEKSSGGFEYKEMLGKKGKPYKHGQGCYKELFYGSLEKSAVETGKEYQEKPKDPKCAEAVKTTAYQVVMTDVVEGSFANGKNATYKKINDALDSTADKKQRNEFIDGLPASFKTNFENLILDGAGKGTFNKDFASDACDKALAKSLDDAKKGKNVAAEKKLKDLVSKLKRDPKRVDKFREKAPAPKKSL